MRTSTTKITFVYGTSAHMRDELLEMNGAYSLDDAVQMDDEAVEDFAENVAMDNTIRASLKELLIHFPDTAVFQFTP